MELTVSTPSKPRLRGVSHQISFFVAGLAGLWLLTRAQGVMFWGCVVYLMALCGQFAVSALYHRPTWNPDARRWWRRLDHAFIMILIAGTGTPLALAIPKGSSHTLLLVLWVGASIGIFRAMVWIHAPKPVAAVLALALAWFTAPFLPELNAVLGAQAVQWLVVGGVLYSMGAIAYATKRPRLWPAVFGYHEVFHLFVILAAACHFFAVSLVVLKASAG
jgi:hemolysin III